MGIIIIIINCLNEKFRYTYSNLAKFLCNRKYGIGADGLNKGAVEKIFIAKNRAPDNPLILHVASTEMVNMIAISRAYEANQKVLQSQDEMLGKAVSDVGRV